MNSRRRHYGVEWGAAIVIAMTFSAAILAQDSDLLGTTIVRPDTDEFSRDNTAGHRSYVELDVLRFAITLTNESTVPLVVDQTRLRQVFTARVGGGAELPVSLRWLQFHAFTPETPRPGSATAPAVINAREAATWTVSIDRNDGGAFTWGNYVVSLSVGNLRSALSTLDGGPWGGRVMEGGAYKRLVSVKAPDAPAETARRWAIVAGAAEGRRDYETALQATLRAAAADSGYEDNLALLYLATGRYKEAIAGYERIAARDGLRDLTAKFLAQSYIGVGEYAKAMQALEKSGVPADEVANEFKRMCKRVDDRDLEIRR